MPYTCPRLTRWPRRTKGEPRVKIRITSHRLEEARKIAPARLRRSPGLLVEEGLRLWFIARQREHFAQGWRAMARDPQAMAINRQLNEEFSVCDNDGL
jgi:hypothetical protein